MGETAMAHERWERVQSLYLKAQQLSSVERSSFLKGACAGDRAMLEEVESLLEYETNVEHFLEDSAIDVVAEMYGSEAFPADDEPADTVENAHRQGDDTAVTNPAA